jgi:hypothetical protein
MLYDPEEARMSEYRKAYEEKFAAQLTVWSTEIALLNAKADRAKAETKIEYYKTIDTLQSKHDAAKAKLQELKAAGDGAWRDLKTGAENVWTEVKTSFGNVHSRFE